MKKYTVLIASICGILMWLQFGLDGHKLFVDLAGSTLLNHVNNIGFIASMVVPNIWIYSRLVKGGTDAQSYFWAILASFFLPLMLGLYFAWQAEIPIAPGDVLVSASTMLVCTIWLADAACKYQKTNRWQPIALIAAMFFTTYLDQCFLHFNYGLRLVGAVQMLGMSLMIAGFTGLLNEDRTEYQRQN